MSGAIEGDVRSLSPGKLVSLFDLDATSVGGPVFYFSNDVEAAGYIPWQGRQYLPLPIKAEGFELSAKQTPSKPRLRVANILGTLMAAINTYGDLRRAKVTRWRTFAQYLDNGSSPSPTRHLPQDIYLIDRLVSRNQVFAEWELTTPLDAEGFTLPARQVLRDVCTHSYRVYSGGAFDYSKATCPYVGNSYFNSVDQPGVTAAEDVCSFSLKGCKLRFPNQPLPTRAFPGVARTR